MSARHYGKIHGTFWTSPTIRALGDDGRTLAAYLLTSPHTTMLGCFRAPDAYVSEDIGWPPERVRAAFDVLHQNGFATRDQAFWVVIHRFLFWNTLDNGNQCKAAMKGFHQLPESAKPSVARGLAQFGEWVPQDVLRPFIENRSGTVPNPGSGSGSGSEAGSGTGTGAPSGAGNGSVGQETQTVEQLALTPPTPKLPKPDPARQVFDAYLEARKAKVGGGHPPALSDKRRALVATRLKDHPVEQLVDAVRGIWASSFHVEKGFTEFDLALRDAEHVERFAALAVPAADAPRRMRTPEEIAELQRLGRYPKHPPRPPETLEELKARNAAEAEESRRRAAIVPASAGAIQEAIRFGIFDEDDERERLASEGRGRGT